MGNLKEYLLNDLRHLPLHPLVREQLLDLQSKVPEDLRGLLCVQFQPDAHGYRPVGLRLQPDPAIEIMNGLLQQTGGETRTVAHGTSLSRVYDGAAFDAILTEKTTLQPSTLVTRDHITRDGGKLDRYYATLDVNYEDSMTLSAAAQLQGLIPTERTLLQRVVAAIPADLRGCFSCDFIRDAGGKTRLHSVSIAPNLAAARLGETVLKPVADAIYEQHPNAPRDNVPGVLGIKHHWRTMTLERAQLENLPDTGRKIA